MTVDRRALVLIVDDNAENLSVLGALLQPHYEVRAAKNGERALQMMQLAPQPDLVVLDVMMPGMDGYQVLAHWRADERCADVPVIFVTALGATEEEERGLAHGAVDYITKPLRPSVLLARVATHIELRRARERLAAHNHSLEAEVLRRLHESERIRDVGIHALARLAETRDNETGFHLVRTREYVRLLCEELLRCGEFAAELDAATAALMTRSAVLHDIGKVGIPDRILHKRGKLDAAEWTVMQTHAWLGAEAIAQAERDAGAGSELDHLRYAKQIALSHHEHWDGGGYPQGLVGEAIPLAARLMAVADVFDALTCQRVYKAAWSHASAREWIVGQCGRQFDPRVVAAFVARYELFCQVACRFSDEADDAQAA